MAEGLVSHKDCEASRWSAVLPRAHPKNTETLGVASVRLSPSSARHQRYQIRYQNAGRLGVAKSVDGHPARTAVGGQRIRLLIGKKGAQAVKQAGSPSGLPLWLLFCGLDSRCQAYRPVTTVLLLGRQQVVRFHHVEQS